MRRPRCGGARGGGSGARRCPRTTPATPRDCPTASARAAAIVIEVSTGIVACERQADKRLSDRLHHEADDRAASRSRTPSCSDTFTASDYRPLPIESQIRLLPRRADEGLRPHARPAAGVRQRRRGRRSPRACRGSRKAFVREMNRRARELGLKNTHYANPIGLDAGGQLLLRARPRDARQGPAHEHVLQEGRGHARRARSRPAIHPRTFRNRNKLVGQLPVGQRRQDRPHARRGLRARRLRQPQRHPAHHRRARHADARPPATATRWRCCNWALPALPAHPRGGRGQGHGHGADPRPPGRDAQASSPDRTVRRIVERGKRDEVKLDVVAPDVVDGPDPQRPAARTRRGPPGRTARRHRRAGRRNPPSPPPTPTREGQVLGRPVRTWSGASGCS